MELTRRAFLRNLGITLSGLVLAGCSRRPRPTATPIITCYEMVVLPTATPDATSTPTPSPTPTPAAQLDKLRTQARLLDSLSTESGLDSETVSRVQAAIERDAAAPAAARDLTTAARLFARLLGLPA